MSFGLDPELFVQRKGSSLATSIHLIDFKAKKSRSDENNLIYSMSKTDGFAFELTNTISSCREFIIPSMAAGLKSFITAHPNHTLSAKASMPLTLKSMSGKTPLGVCDYGCIPDQSAYTLMEKTPPSSAYHNRMRYIGGHIHMGLHGFPAYTSGPGSQYPPKNHKTYNQEWQNTAAAAHALLWDALVAVPMVAILGHINDYGEKLRRTYYGQAGSHRVKNYGAEYRVLSGALMLSPFLLSWALGAMRYTIQSSFLQPIKPTIDLKGNHNNPTVENIHTIVAHWFDNNELQLENVRNIIDTNNVIAARKYCNSTMSQHMYNLPFIKTMIKADKRDIPLPTNIIDAWQLKSKITNHIYPGVEHLMNYPKTIKKEQFKAHDLIVPIGWNTELN